MIRQSRNLKKSVNRDQQEDEHRGESSHPLLDRHPPGINREEGQQELSEDVHERALSAYLTAMSQFHNYSFQNILLIASQRPTATRFAGIRSWNELGRRVKRGEKGIMIFAPMIGYKRNASDGDQSDARTDKPEPRLVGFRAVYVFDRLSRDLRPSLCAPDRSRP